MESLQGWCIVWVPKHSDVPSMTSNIADEELANDMASEMLLREKAREIICVLHADELRKRLNLVNALTAKD